MKDEHITGILESAPFNSLSESEMLAIRAHSEHCEACRQAFQAAQVSALLIRERALSEIEPPPFFQTRVMAALRERQAGTESAASTIRRLWKATGALFSGMTATVATLALLTLVAPSPDAASQDPAYASGTYSAEEVIFARADQDDMSYDQVLSTIYEADAER